MSIEIAIIDSGVTPWHSHVQGVAGGISFEMTDSGKVLVPDDYRDETGHGTALAARMLEQNPRQGTEWVRQTLKSVAEEEIIHGDREWSE